VRKGFFNWREGGKSAWVFSLKPEASKVRHARDGATSDVDLEEATTRSENRVHHVCYRLPESAVTQTERGPR